MRASNIPITNQEREIGVTGDSTMRLSHHQSVLSSDQKGKWDVGNYRKENTGGKKILLSHYSDPSTFRYPGPPHLNSTQQNYIASVTVTEYGVIFMEK